MNFLRKNSFITLVLTGLLIALLAVAGCGVTSTETATSTTTSTTTTTTQVVAFDLNVSAAASLTDAITEINNLYMSKHTNITVLTNLASSGTLQKQIEQGAPADVFISAGAKQMQALQDGGLLLDGTRQDLLTNKVVLVVPSNSTLNITSFTDLTKANILKIAIGDPESVPVGTYGKQALEQLGVYNQVQPKLILCADVKQVLSYVEAGNVDAGIVFATDAAISKSVVVVAAAPAEVNNSIIYPIAIVKATKNADAASAYLAFLTGSEAKVIFEKYGFVVVAR